MIKKLLVLVFVLVASTQAWSQTIIVNESAGWLESAFVKWQPVVGVESYNVYYSGNGITDRKIDTQLIRSYGSYFRADVLGLAAGNYTLKVAPVIAGVEGLATVTNSLTVLAQDRTGFAFENGRVPGAYKADGTPKDGAVIIYVTENNKNTVSATITGASANPCVGLQNILYGIKKGKDIRPFIFRLIGTITDMDVMEGGDITIENAQNASSYLTLEGVGSDAVINGMGIRLKSATNIEVRNLASMNCNSTAGDNFGLQQDNDHIWLHNCDMFYGDAGSDADQVKGDGSLDNKNSTYITFSYNHFWDSGKASLLGLSEGTTSGLYITYHHNWFDHSDSRHPRVRYYSAHVYNNYYDGNSKYGVGSTLGSSVFVEGNYFRDCKYPMMTSMQGTDVWDATKQINDPTNMATFSKEDGGSIKAFNNTFDASNGANNMRFVAYGDPSPAFNIAGKISSTVDFDAYNATTRAELVPSTVKSFKGANTYNNFDTDAALYIKNLVIDEPSVARDKAIQYAGRVEGGDLKFTFNNTVDDASYLVNTTIKTALSNYTTSLVAIQGENPIVMSSQTLSTNTNNDQTVAAETAIEPMIFTWGGDATDATVIGLPASGITSVKEGKTITILGIPTANVSFTITTTGSAGIPATGTGIITLAGSATGDMVHNFTEAGKTSSFYNIVGNMNSTAGAVSYDGLAMTARLKIESATTITYTTSAVSTLTLVFDNTFTSYIKLDNVITANAVAGVITIPSIPAGTHVITKGSTTNLFYIKSVYHATGIEDKDAIKLTLFPNPILNKLVISSDNNVEKTEIYSVTGILVKRSGSGITSIDMSNLNSGSYIVKVYTNGGIYKQLVIKK